MNSLSQAFGGNSNSNHNSNHNNNYNHLSQYSRQATITSLPGKPLMQQQFTENGNFDRVRLGSMPGIYRLIRADSSAPYLPAPPTSGVTPTLSTLQAPTGPSSIDQTDNELSATVSSSRIAPDGHSQSNSTFNHKQLQAIENQLSHMESSVVSAPTIANASALALLSSSRGDTSSSSSPSSFARQAKELQPFKSSGTSGVAAAVATTTTTTAATTGPLGDSNTASSLELLQSMDELSLSPASTSTARHMQAWQFKRQQDELVLPKPVEVSSKILFVERASSGSAAAAGAAAASATGGADLTRAAIMPVSQREARLYHASDQLQHNYQQQLQQQQVLSLSSLSSPPSPSSAGPAKQPYQQEQVARSGGVGSNAPLASGRRRQQLATSDTMAAGQRQAPIVRTGANLEKSKAALSMAATDIGDDESLAPIIMTNNHRIAGDYLALSQLADMKQQHQEQQQQGQVRRPTEKLPGEPQVESNFSIKYSASRVDDYSLGKLATTNLPATIDESSDHNHNDDGHDHDKSTGRSMSTTNVAFLAQPPLPPSPPPPITSQAARSRSGRMRQIASVASPPPPASLSDKLLATKMTSASSGTAVDFESRMGDAIHATAPNGGESDSAGQRQSSLVGADLLVGDASNRSEQVAKRVTSSSLGDEQVAANATIASQPPFQQQQQPQQHSLAHNITGALIRWSLKTLGNLARKSLESLVVVDEPAPNRLDSFAGRTLFSSTLAPLVADSSLPPSMRQNISHRSNATTRLQLSAPGKLATNALAIESNGQLGSKPQPTTDHDDNQLDGFLINRSATLDHNPARVTSTITPKQLLVSSGTSTNSLPATTVLADSSARQARQQSNTSSTPLQANLQQPLAATTTATALKTTTSTPMPPLSPNVRFRHRSRQFQQEAPAAPENIGRDKQQQQQQQTEVKASEPVDSIVARSLWPIYAFCALICLIALIMVAFFFVLVPNRGRQHEPLSAAYQQQAPPPAPPTFTGKSLLARLNETLRKNAAQHASSSNFSSNWRCPTTIDQTKVGPVGTTNCTNGQISNKQLMLVRGSNLTSSRNSVVCHERSGQFANMSPSLSGSSATTRSTSAASTSCSSSMGGENCNNNNSNSNKNKNSEQFVVYTDYLLLNDDDDNNNDDDNDRASLATGQDAYCSQTMQRSSRRLPSESFA